MNNMLVKFLQYKFLNSFLYSFVPVLRVPAIFFFIGGDFFKKYVLVLSLASFISEILFLAYDSRKINDRSDLKFIINKAFLLSLVFILIGVILENALICIISYVVFDQLSIIDSVNRDKHKSIYYHLVRLVTVLLIVFKLYFLIFFVSLISYLFLVRSESTFASRKIFNDLLKNIKLVGIIRIRDFFLNKFLIVFLDNNIFFVFKIVQAGFGNLSGLHYTYVRNNILDSTDVKKYFQLIKKFILIISGAILLLLGFSFFINQIYLLYLLILLIPILFSIENIIAQLNLIYLKDAINRMTLSNFFVLFGFGMINILIYKIPITLQNANIYVGIIFLLTLSSIYFLLKNKKLRIK